jgi:hypothetical protein
MVDRSRDRAGHNGGHLPWRRVLLIGTLGLSAVAQLLLGRRGRGEPPAERAPLADIEHANGEEEIRHPDGRIEHPSVRNEPTDVNVRAIVGILVIALVLGAIIHGAIFGFFNGYRDYLSEARRSPFPLAPVPANGLPPEPRLEQLDRMEDIERGNVYLREKAKEETLTSFGPTDEKGYVHIPIEQAMKQIKLPARKTQPQTAARDRGLVDSGEPNSGRMFRREARWFER